MPARGDGTDTALDARARILLVRTLLQEYTDEKHSLTVNGLISRLELAGCSADRRTIRSDVALLQRSGMDIRVRRGKANEYYLATRAFELSELRVLADMARASRALSHVRAESIIEKLSMQASRYDAAALRRFCGGANPRKTDGESAYQNAVRIRAALERGRKLSFVYCLYTAKKSLAPKRGGEPYIVSPWLLVYAEDHYYLIADHPAHEGFAHYRLDKMTDLRMLEEAAVPADPSFDTAAYVKTLFDMAPAGLRWVRLAFDQRHLDAMVDRFGADVPLERDDERSYTLFAPVRVSPPFFGWLFQFGGGVRILAPDDVRETMLLMLESARAGACQSKTNQTTDDGGSRFVSHRTR